MQAGDYVLQDREALLLDCSYVQKEKDNNLSTAFYHSVLPTKENGYQKKDVLHIVGTENKCLEHVLIT